MIQYEGLGWRLARDPSRKNYTVLIGGLDWASELTEQEWQSLMPLLNDLISQYEKVKNQLMPKENISLEIERMPWWACIEGTRNAWTLKLILASEEVRERSLEMYWPIPSAQKISSAMRKMWDSSS